MEDFEEFQDIKKEFDAQHACWNNKSKYDKDNKENSKDELKTRVLNSKSDQQDKPILKVSDLNTENNFKRAEFTTKKINAANAKSERNNTDREKIQRLKIKIGLQNFKISSKQNIQEEKKQNKNSLNRKIKEKEQNNRELKEEDRFENSKVALEKKDWDCIQCDASFSQLENLTKHINDVHEGRKCSKSFVQLVHKTAQVSTVHEEKSILKISDLNIENNSKRADFTAKKNASVAAENVENENPVDVQNILKPIHLAGTGMGWKCPSCPYKTKIVQNLDKHMRTHTGEKPFTCPQCDYSTAQKSNLTKHAKRVHGEN